MFTVGLSYGYMLKRGYLKTQGLDEETEVVVDLFEYHPELGMMFLQRISIRGIQQTSIVPC